MPSVTSEMTLDALNVLAYNLDTLANEEEEDDEDEDNDHDFMEEFVHDGRLRELLAMYDVLDAGMLDPPEKELRDAVATQQAVMEQLIPAARRYDEASELYHILLDPHLRHFVEVYDDVCNFRFEPEVGQPVPNEQVGSNLDVTDKDAYDYHSQPHPSEFSDISTPPATMSRVPKLPRVVEIDRGLEGEPLGFTVVRQDFFDQDAVRAKVVIERILAGSLVEQQGQLKVGDVVLEVSDQVVDSAETMLRLLRANVEDGKPLRLKVISGITRPHSVVTDLSKTYIRTFCDYDPRTDSLLPSESAGLSFQAGDILELVDRDDPNWWQVRTLDCPNGKARLIPSQTLEERRKAFVKPLSNVVNHNSNACASIKNKKKTKKSGKHLFSVNDSAEIMSRTDIWVYEDVVQYPSSRMPCLLLIGATGVGRRTLKMLLAQRESYRFDFPIPDTTEPMVPGGDLFNHVSRAQMEADIRAGQYIEYGDDGGYLYGIRYATIREIIAQGKTAVLDCQAKTVPLLRRPEFHPYIVFIAAPAIEVLKSMLANGLSRGLTTNRRSDDELRTLVEESARFERFNRHLYNAILMNDGMENCVTRLVGLVQRVERQPSWIPAAWEYEMPPPVKPLTRAGSELVTSLEGSELSLGSASMQRRYKKKPGSMQQERSAVPTIPQAAERYSASSSGDDTPRGSVQSIPQPRQRPSLGDGSRPESSVGSIQSLPQPPRQKPTLSGAGSAPRGSIQSLPVQPASGTGTEPRGSVQSLPPQQQHRLHSSVSEETPKGSVQSIPSAVGQQPRQRPPSSSNASSVQSVPSAVAPQARQRPPSSSSGASFQSVPSVATQQPKPRQPPSSSAGSAQSTPSTAPRPSASAPQSKPRQPPSSSNTGSVQSTPSVGGRSSTSGQPPKPTPAATGRTGSRGSVSSTSTRSSFSTPQQQQPLINGRPSLLNVITVESNQPQKQQGGSEDISDTSSEESD